MSDRRLPARREDDALVFNHRAEAPLAARGLIRLREMAARRSERLDNAKSSQCGPALRWAFNALDSEQFGEAILVRSDRVVVATDTTCYNLEIAMGTLRWVFKEDDWIDSYPGITSDNDSVYVATNSSLYALDAFTGVHNWHIYGDYCWFAVHDLFYLADYDGNVRALDPRSGHRQWWTWQWNTWTTAGLALANGILLLASGPTAPDHPELVSLLDDHLLRACDAQTGKHLWKHVLHKNPKCPPAILAAGESVFAMVEKGTISNFDVRTGREYWRCSSRMPLPAAVASGIVFVYQDDGEGEELCALDMNTGATLWRFQNEGKFLMFRSSAMGVIIIESASRLFVVDVKTGSNLWSVSLQTDDESDTVVCITENMILVSMTDTLEGHERDPIVRAFSLLTGEMLWTLRILSPPTFMSASDGVTYLGIEDWVYAIDYGGVCGSNKLPAGKEPRFLLWDDELVPLTNDGILRSRFWQEITGQQESLASVETGLGGAPPEGHAGSSARR